MADLPSGFWSGWIIVLTLVSLAGVAWLSISIYFSKDAETQADHEPVWDTDLKEGNNAPPMWWFWMLFAAMIFSLIYLMFFPGLGSYSGLLNWSQGSRVADSYANYEATFADSRQVISDASLEELQNDLDLMATAERIFTRECSPCHGPDGRGQAAMFPNLHDIDWQWGGTPEQIEQSIRQGRNAIMISWQQMLGNDLDAVTEYVSLLSEGNNQSHAGKAGYDQNCVVCHGPTGDGNQLLGAPRLNDDTWLYGGDIDSIRMSLTNGRFGVMPAFDQRLDDVQIKLLVALLAR